MDFGKEAMVIIFCSPVFILSHHIFRLFYYRKLYIPSTFTSNIREFYVADILII